MQTQRSSFIRASATLMVIGLIALTCIVGTTVMLVDRAQRDFNVIIAERDLRIATTSLRILLHELESSQRGFLLTEDEAYLLPYNEAYSRVVPAISQLLESINIHPEYRSQMEELSADLTRKIEEMQRTIDLVRSGRRDEAIQIVSTDHGKEIMDQARTLLREIVRSSDEGLTEGVEEQRRSAGMLHLIALVGGVIIIAVVGGSVWMALRYTRDLLTARSEVEALNEGLEQRVAERTHDLIRANEEVQRFAYIVTHDLRAPLVNIMGFTSELNETMKSIQAYVLADGDQLSELQITEARTAASEDLPEAIGFIRKSTRKMDSLINAILKISREGKRPLKPETIDLDALLEANLATIQHQVVEDHGTTTLNVHAPDIISDRMSLDQIIGNLLDNAIKYRSPNRPIAIKITADRAPGRQIRIAVSDNGRGIPEADHQRVFDLFRRSGQQDQQGEGIGLAHVRTLTRSLGGDITLSSAEGEGTTFTITLPIDVRTVVRTMDNEQV